MNKSVLVMDTPDKCGECVLRMAMICTPTMKDIDSVNTKMDWCPLSKLPDEKEISHFCETSTDWQKGYNTCLNDILTQ